MILIKRGRNKKKDDISKNSTWNRFKRHTLAIIGAIIVVSMILIAIFAPLIAPQDPNKINIREVNSSPSVRHLLGTDSVGRDVASRLIFAARISITVGILAVLIQTVIGTTLGAIAGYYGGVIDNVIMRITDIFLSFPIVIIVMTVISAIGANMWNIILAIGFIRWTKVCRLIRAEFRSLKERNFVEAAIAISASPFKIIFKHMLPNAITPIVVASTFSMAEAVILEASLSFLGFGVQPPTASWGNILMEAQSLTILESMYWLWVPPGLAISLTVIGLNFLGDGLVDAFNPRLKNI